MELETLATKYRIVCIHGFSGSGKSVLAKTYIRTKANAGLHFFCEAENDDVLLTHLGNLYQQLMGIAAYKLLPHDNKKLFIEQLLANLNGRLQINPWAPAVIILDNASAKSSTLLSQIVSSLESVQFILTTQNATLLESQHNRGGLNLNAGWLPHEGDRFLIDIESSEQARQALIDYLCYPLGLHVAAQTIEHLRKSVSTTDYNAATYLRELKQGITDRDERETLTSIRADNIEYRQAAVIEKAISLIEETDGNKLLQFLSNLADLPIPVKLINRYFINLYKANNREVAHHYLRAIQSLTDFSLIENQGENITIHAMIRDVAHRKLPLANHGWLTWWHNKLDIIAAITNSLCEYCVGEEEAPVEMDKRLELKRIIQHSEQWLVSGATYLSLTQVCETRDAMASSLEALGLASKARQCNEKVLAIKNSLYGSKHVEVAKAKVNLGISLMGLNNFSGAIRYFEEALPILEQDKDSLQLVPLLINWGNALRFSDQPKTAIPYYRRALKIQENIENKEEKKLARSKTLLNLGTALEAIHRCKCAIKCYKKALKNRKPYYLKHDPHITILMGNIAAALGALGRTVEAKEKYEEILPLQEKCYGEIDLALVNTLLGLGISSANLKEHTDAKDYFERAKTILENTFSDEEHPELIRTNEFITKHMRMVPCLYNNSGLLNSIKR